MDERFPGGKIVKGLLEYDPLEFCRKKEHTSQPDEPKREYPV